MNAKMHACEKGLLLSAVVMSMLVASAADHYMKSDDPGGKSSFNSGLNWDDGKAPCAGKTYMTGNKTLRTPDTSGNPSAASGVYTFAGDSLSVGGASIGNAGPIALKTIGANVAVRVDDLRLVRGSISVSASGAPARLQGKLTIDEASNKLPVNASDNWCGHVDAGDGGELWLESSLVGSGAVYLRFRSSATKDPSLFYIKGDNSQYLGRFMSDGAKSIVIFDGATSLGGKAGWIDNKLYLRNNGAMAFSSALPQPIVCPGGMMYVDASGGALHAFAGETTEIGFTINVVGPLAKTGPGTIFHNCECMGSSPVTIKEGAFGFNFGDIKTSNPPVVVNAGGYYANMNDMKPRLTPPHMTFAGGGVQIPYSASAAAAGVLTLQADAVVAWPLPIRLTEAPLAGQRVKVLSVPCAVKAVTPADFTITYPNYDVNNMPIATFEVEPNGDNQDVYVRVREWTKFTGTGDKQWYPSKTYDGASGEYAWADHCSEMSNAKDYLFDVAASIRVGQNNTAAIDYTMPGASLSVKRYNSTLAIKCYRAIFPQLHFINGIIVPSGCSNLQPGQYADRQFLAGNIRIGGWDTAMSQFQSAGNKLVLEADLSGTGVASFQTYTKDLSTTTYIVGDKPNFYGDIDVYFNGTTGSGVTLEIDSPGGLGAPSKTVGNIRGLRLRNLGFVRPATTMTFDAANRGIWAECGGFDVPTGVVFTVRQDMRIVNKFIKKGKGLLAFGPSGKMQYGQEGWRTPDGANNCVEVWDGSIQALTTNAFNGSKIVMKGSSSLAVSVDSADAEVAKYGLVNPYAVPFALESGELRVSLAPADESAFRAAEREGRQIPICTVTDAAAVGLNGKFRMMRGPGYWRGAAVSSKSANGMTTFYTTLIEELPTVIFIK